MARDRAQVVTRFAPSPTGHLHLGHLYAALFARDLAAEHGGRFLLRFEDIDTTRVREQYYTQIERDLEHLGFEWELPALRQTSRAEQYQLALDQLKELDVVYPCFCTRKDIQRELAAITRAPHGPDGPLYPGTCSSLSKYQINQRILNGEEPSWRLNYKRAKELTSELSFTDSINGVTAVDHGLLGDLILARKDIGTSYHIAVVVDDAHQAITDVTRGKDLLESTHVHRILQALLEFPEPRYHHHDLVCDDDGQRLAKRVNSLAISQLIADGLSNEQIYQLMLKNIC